MPNPTPQQRIEELVREFDAMFEYTDFSGDIGGLILRMKDDRYDTEETLRAKLRQALIQAYVAGLEDVSKLVASNSKGSFTDDGGNDGWYIDDLLSHISQLKEQATKHD
jgi:hypothetical protein